MRILRWLATPRLCILHLVILAATGAAPSLLAAGYGWPWWAADLAAVAGCAVLWTGVDAGARQLGVPPCKSRS